MASFVKAAKASELKSGDARVVEIEGKTYALFNVEGKFYRHRHTSSTAGLSARGSSTGRRDVPLARVAVRGDDGGLQDHPTVAVACTPRRLRGTTPDLCLADGRPYPRRAM